MRRFIFVWLCLLSACSGRGTLTTTHIEAVLSADRFTPSQWRIPGGQVITLKLTNATAEEREWALLITPPTAPYSTDDEINLIVKFSVPANQSETVTFTAPAAPGEYSVTSTLPGQLEAGLLGKVTIVQPGY
jgi:hypothetical protein